LLACWDCGSKFCRWDECLSVVFYQVEVTASDRSLAQRSPTACGVSNECGCEAQYGETMTRNRVEALGGIDFILKWKSCYHRLPTPLIVQKCEQIMLTFRNNLCALHAFPQVINYSKGRLVWFWHNCEFYTPVTKLGRNTPTQKLDVRMSRGYRIYNSRNKQFPV